MAYTVERVSELPPRFRIERVTVQYTVERVSELPPYRIERVPELPLPEKQRRAKKRRRAPVPVGRAPITFWDFTVPERRLQLSRGCVETIFDILSWMAHGFSHATPIMYHTNLSWNPLQYYFGVLIRIGWVQVQGDGERKKYFLTDDGLDALSRMKPDMWKLIMELRRSGGPT